MQITICFCFLPRLSYAQFIVFWVSLLLECYSKLFFFFLLYFRANANSTLSLFFLSRRLVRVWRVLLDCMWPTLYVRFSCVLEKHVMVVRWHEHWKCENSWTHMEHFNIPSNPHIEEHWKEKKFFHRQIANRNSFQLYSPWYWQTFFL